MTPLQLYESLVQAAGLRREPEPLFAFQRGTRPRKNSSRSSPAGTRSRPSNRTSILQVLTLMNGRLMADATSLDRRGTLPAVAESLLPRHARQNRGALPGGA